MAEPFMVGGLKEKRAELSGIIANLEKRINQHRADLVHVDAVLRLFAPDITPETIAPKAPRRRNEWFPPGELSRMVLDVLRLAPTPLSIRDITVQVCYAGASIRTTPGPRSCCASWSTTPSTAKVPSGWS